MSVVWAPVDEVDSSAGFSRASQRSFGGSRPLCGGDAALTRRACVTGAAGTRQRRYTDAAVCIFRAIYESKSGAPAALAERSRRSPTLQAVAGGPGTDSVSFVTPDLFRGPLLGERAA